nr:hypothetical protein Iba_chr01bCG5410 [Ipomoea batatas]
MGNQALYRLSSCAALKFEVVGAWRNGLVWLIEWTPVNLCHWLRMENFSETKGGEGGGSSSPWRLAAPQLRCGGLRTLPFIGMLKNIGRMQGVKTGEILWARYYGYNHSVGLVAMTCLVYIQEKHGVGDRLWSSSFAYALVLLF